MRSTDGGPPLGPRFEQVELIDLPKLIDVPKLSELIERSAVLKRALVQFACSPRLERHLSRFMLEVADGMHDLAEGDAVAIIDTFVLECSLPNGKTVLDQFLASRPDLSAADRTILRGWSDPVKGFFEIVSKDRDSIVLLNLLDDLEYRTYSNMGPAAFDPLPKRGFVFTHLLPIHPVPGAWLISGSVSAYPKSSGAKIAQIAIDLAASQPELVFRNPEKIGQGWEQMREDRAAFIEFFGTDELVFTPGEVVERLNGYYRHRQEAALASSPKRRRTRKSFGLDSGPSTVMRCCAAASPGITSARRTQAAP